MESDTSEIESSQYLEHRFDSAGGVSTVKVCRAGAPSNESIISSAEGDMIVTCAADDLDDFEHDDPHFLARRVVVDVSTRLPGVSQSELLAFEDTVGRWICGHRGNAALRALAA